MFKIVSNPRFRHVVTVLVPVDGGHAEQTLGVTFRVLSSDEAEAHDLSTTAGMDAFLRAIVVGLDDVVDDDGHPLPFSDGMRDRVLGPMYVKLAVLRAYTAALGKARLGN